MPKISKNIKKLRAEKNLTQDALAEKLHVTRQAISNWENDKTKPDIEALEMLAQVLQVDIEELIYGEKKAVIVSQDKTKQKNRIKIILGIVGSILVASGLAILFFGFWQDFGLPLKTVLSVVPMVAGQGFALFAYLKKKDNKLWCESAGIIWAIGTISTIALVDGIHRISWSYTDYLVIDSILLIPVLFIFSSIIPLVFYYYMSIHIATVGNWQNLLFSLLLFAVGILFTWYLSRDKEDTRGKIAEWITMIASIPQLFVLIYAGFEVEILPGTSLVIWAIFLSAFLGVYIASIDNTAVASPFKPISTLGVCGAMLMLAIGASHDVPEMWGDKMTAFVVFVVLCVAIPLITVLIKRERFEDEPFKIAKITVPFIMIGIMFIYSVVDNLIIRKEQAPSWDVESKSYILEQNMDHLLIILPIVFGGMLIYEGIKELKIFTVNVGLITEFISILGIFINSDVSDILLLGALFVIFGVAIIFVNWKMFSIKKSRQEHVDGGEPDA